MGGELTPQNLGSSVFDKSTVVLLKQELGPIIPSFFVTVYAPRWEEEIIKFANQFFFFLAW